MRNHLPLLALAGLSLSGCDLLNRRCPEMSSPLPNCQYDGQFPSPPYDDYPAVVGWGSGSPDGHATPVCDEYGFCSSAGSTSSGRDTLAEIGEIEARRIASAGQRFSAQYHLSAATGLNVVKAFYDFRELSAHRTRTDADVKIFVQRTYGLDAERITSAITEMEKGNLGPIHAAVSDAADYWGTTPETMQVILKSWYGDQIPSNAN